MKRIYLLLALILLFTGCAFGDIGTTEAAQSPESEYNPNNDDDPADIDIDSYEFQELMDDYYSTHPEEVMTSEDMLDYVFDHYSSEELLEYLSDSMGEKLWTTDEATWLFVYAYQRGYETGINGTWDDMAEEYIEGYEVPKSVIEEIEDYFGV